MKKLAEASIFPPASHPGTHPMNPQEKSVDLLLVDSGDLHDGSGLTDGYPSGGINGEEAIKSFLKVPYDVMAIGNHELYVGDVARDMYVISTLRIIPS
ncbi:hypothetical protein BN14_01437 [Rhizoctonia solani AG-1 IB]|uniref:Calcineurin-like phosphoesterase domain-containing protein n=1 Tax=Thanatephorus cucumeris (strain AG1-IB / isolate 7/3/14) TaxID=1108050 RepID=M5BKV8_THACB|nr:hypothetical protein BN14_01437 [Rhizoctonia solani AG-1 IB]